MNESQLRTILLKNPVTRPFYGGVLALDEIPVLVEKSPIYYVLNTDTSLGPGIHWVSIFIDGVSEFFDSLGKPPNMYGPNIVALLIFNGSSYAYNSSRLQSYNSDICGKYCVYFIHFRCLGYSFEEIMSSFTNNLYENDLMVSLFFNQLCSKLFD